MTAHSAELAALIDEIRQVNRTLKVFIELLVLSHGQRFEQRIHEELGNGRDNRR